jgi:hypothetical protein
VLLLLLLLLLCSLLRSDLGRCMQSTAWCWAAEDLFYNDCRRLFTNSLRCRMQCCRISDT